MWAPNHLVSWHVLYQQCQIVVGWCKLILILLSWLYPGPFQCDSEVPPIRRWHLFLCLFGCMTCSGQKGADKVMLCLSKPTCLEAVQLWTLSTCHENKPQIAWGMRLMEQRWVIPAEDILGQPPYSPLNCMSKSRWGQKPCQLSTAQTANLQNWEEQQMLAVLSS